MVLEPILHVVQRGTVEIGHRADGRVMVGVAYRIEVLQLLVFDQPERLVIALPLLVLDDAALVIEHLLRHRAEQVAHPVALEEQRHVERAGRHGLEIIGAVEPGGAVVVGRADLLQRLEEIARRILAAVKHQVLEQVGETGLALGLVLGADSVPHRYRHDRRLAVLVHQHGEAVVEGELLVGNVDVGDQLRERRGLELGEPGGLLRDGRGGSEGKRKGERGGDSGRGQEASHGARLITRRAD